jgi:hypothetical protein
MTTAAANCLPLANRGYGDLEANNNGALHAHERAPPGGASYGTASTEKLAPRRRLAVTCIAACGVALLTVLVALVAWLGVLVSAAQRTLNALQVRTPRGVHAPARYTRSEQVNCAVGVCEGAVAAPVWQRAVTQSRGPLLCSSALTLLTPAFLTRAVSECVAQPG